MARPEGIMSRATRPRLRSIIAYRRSFGEGARARGAANEERLLEAVLSLRAGAAWVLDARPATPEEDARGVDVVVTSDIGALYLQSKSSRAGVAKFEAVARKLRIEAVLVSIYIETTAARALVALQVLRAEIVRERATQSVTDVAKAKAEKARAKAAQDLMKAERREAKRLAATPKKARLTKIDVRNKRKAEARNARLRTTIEQRRAEHEASIAAKALRDAERRDVLQLRCPCCNRNMSAPSDWRRVVDGAWACEECSAQMDRDMEYLGRPVSARAAGRLLAIVGGAF